MDEVNRDLNRKLAEIIPKYENLEQFRMRNGKLVMKLDEQTNAVARLNQELYKFKIE